MTLHSPFIITARLLPGVRVGNGFLSIEYAGQTDDGRTRYRYSIDYGDKEHTAQDLKSGIGGGSLQEGMGSLLSFLGAAIESYCHDGMKGENSDLFPESVLRWASEFSDDISMLQIEIEETKNLIQE